MCSRKFVRLANKKLCSPIGVEKNLDEEEYIVRNAGVMAGCHGVPSLERGIPRVWLVQSKLAKKRAEV